MIIYVLYSNSNKEYSVDFNLNLNKEHRDFENIESLKIKDSILNNNDQC